MSKNIFLLCDGTGNGYLTDTNVRKLSKILHRNIADLNSSKDDILYLQGVAVHDKPDKAFVLDFATASDVVDKLVQAYGFICDRYEFANIRELRFWLFGFSRGSFTARTIANIIYKFGIIKLSNEEREVIKGKNPSPSANVQGRLKQVCSMYFTNLSYSNYHHNGTTIEEFRDLNCWPNSWEKEVYFLGLWDSVGAVGIPFLIPCLGIAYDELFTHEVYGVKFAYHAMSIHENLTPFEPTHVLVKGAKVVKEVWFPGRHLDIGGCIGSTPTSRATLKWMIDGIQISLEPLGINVDLTIPKDTVIETGATNIYNYFSGLYSDIINKFQALFGRNHVLRDRVIPVKIPIKDSEGFLNILSRDWRDLVTNDYVKTSSTLKVYFDNLLAVGLITQTEYNEDKNYFLYKPEPWWSLK